MPQSASEIFKKKLQFFALPEIASLIRFVLLALLASLAIAPRLDDWVQRSSNPTTDAPRSRVGSNDGWSNDGRAEIRRGSTMDDPTMDVPRLRAGAQWTIQRWTRMIDPTVDAPWSWRWSVVGYVVTFMLPHAVVTLSHLGHPQVELILFFWHLFSHFKHYEHWEKWDSTWASSGFALPMTQSMDLIISVKSVLW